MDCIKRFTSPALTLIKDHATEHRYQSPAQSAVSSEMFVTPVLQYLVATSITSVSGGSSDRPHVPLSALTLKFTHLTE